MTVQTELSCGWDWKLIIWSRTDPSICGFDNTHILLPAHLQSTIQVYEELGIVGSLHRALFGNVWFGQQEWVKFHAMPPPFPSFPYQLVFCLLVQPHHYHMRFIKTKSLTVPTIPGHDFSSYDALSLAKVKANTGELCMQKILNNSHNSPTFTITIQP